MIAKQKNGLKWYESESLSQMGVKHGFFTRLGGVSQRPYDSLNVKFDIDDVADNVELNRQKVFSILGVKQIRFAPLVHGSNISIVTNDSADTIEGVDGLIATQAGLAIALSVADCLPIIISDGEILSVVHAGWRGTVKKITSKAIARMVLLGLKPEKTTAVLGPCICHKHFEVRNDAAKQLKAASGEGDLPTGETYHADLVAINRQQLEDAGISTIESLDICSYESDEFYSYRADNGKTGRNMAIALLS